ncbi:XRE family transcriptional regulator [Roseomonas sp. CCTCC AB2023176]|uniref:XRE family transcriptional regulator n=1 Tax=Roseomonas sp. CCTCC AB2023176 TaxID=3342640 RepID=UPI0035DA13BE
MSDVAALQELAGPNGGISVDRLSAVLRTTRADIAGTLGLPRDAVSKSARAQAPRTQQRLREMVEILNRVRPWFGGSMLMAYAWYRSQGLPGFGDRTAEALVREGKAGAVRDYLEAVADGGYA